MSAERTECYDCKGDHSGELCESDPHVRAFRQALADAQRQLKFFADVLALSDIDHDDHHVWDNIWTIVREGTVSFMVNANDLFFWACADGEYITPENLPVLRQAIVDVRAALGVSAEPNIRNEVQRWELWNECPSHATSLFAARVRGMRPQRPCYKNFPEALHPLFNACGPERDPKDEG